MCRSDHRYSLVALTSGMALLATCFVTGCGSSSAAGSHVPDRRSPSPSFTSGRPAVLTAVAPAKPPAMATYVHRVRIGREPCATLGAAGSVWVSDVMTDRVVRLDPKSGAILGTVHVGDQPCGMA